MDPSKRSSERTPFKDLSNTISTNTIYGGEPTDGRERGRQRRQIYAQMDPQKKDELLKKRRESYQQKKAKLQCTHPVTNSGESNGGPSTLTQLESQPAVKGQNAMHTENVVPAANEVFQLQSPHMSSQGQQSFMTDNVDINNICTNGPKSLMIHATPIYAKKQRRQQDRERYAQMDPQKKDELLKKRRESYQQKKAKLQCTRESNDGTSALAQLESTPAIKGQNAMNTENVVPAANEAYQLQSPHMSSQGQQRIMTENVDINYSCTTGPKSLSIHATPSESLQKRKSSTLNKENEVPSEDDEWLRRNDNYQRQSIPMPFQRESIVPTEVENCGSNEPTSPRIQPQPVVVRTKKKKERKRERYAQMDTDSKNELLARRNATYQQKRSLSEQIEKMRARDRLRYASMSPKKKQAKQTLHELRRNSLSKESNATENPCWVPGVVHTPDTQRSIPTCDWHIPDFSGTPIYIEPISEQMSGEVTPDMDVSNKSRRKHVTPGERHALLGLRNEAFYANSKKHAISSAAENPSMSIQGVNGSETPTQAEVVRNETTPPLNEIGEQLQTQSTSNDDGDDEGVILEEDSEDEEGYMFVGQENADEDVEIDELVQLV
ncbi:hypothetical protein ACQ4PT_041735 [Festuca glaucescens]